MTINKTMMTELLTTFGANFKQLCIERAVARTHNIRLKEILKKGALTVIQTVVHLSNSCGYTNSRASNPPFLKLL